MLQVEGQVPLLTGDWGDVYLTRRAVVFAGAASDGPGVRRRATEGNQRLRGDLRAAERVRSDALRLLALRMNPKQE